MQANIMPKNCIRSNFTALNHTKALRHEGGELGYSRKLTTNHTNNTNKEECEGGASLTTRRGGERGGWRANVLMSRFVSSAVRGETRPIPARQAGTDKNVRATG